MAKDKEPVALPMEGDAETEPEVVIVPTAEDLPKEEPAEDPEKTELRKQLEELKKASNSTEAMTAGLAKLGETLGRPQTAPSVVVSPQQPGETPEEFQKRVNEQLFGPNPVPIIQEIINRTISPALANTHMANLQVSEKLMELDPDDGVEYRKYKKEIKEFIAALPQASQYNPQVYKFAYDQVKLRHVKDIAEDEVTKRVNARLKELGLEPEGEASESSAAPKKTRGDYFQESGSAPKPAARKIVATEDEKRRSERLGIPIEEIISRRGSVRR